MAITLVYTGTEEQNRKIEEQKRKAEEQQREENVQQIFRALSANMLRVLRGSGNTFDLVDQALRFAEALKELPLGFDHTFILHNAAKVRDYKPGYNGQDRDRMLIEDEIVDASLQLAAGRILKQNTQISKSHGKLQTALLEWDALRRSMIKKLHRGGRSQ